MQGKFSNLVEKLCQYLGNANLMKAENGKCFYLGADNQCLIHSIRPGTCRLFPYVQKKIIQLDLHIPKVLKSSNVQKKDW